MNDRLSGTSIDQLKTMRMKDGAIISAMSTDEGMNSQYSNIDQLQNNQPPMRQHPQMQQLQTQQQPPSQLQLMQQYNQAKNKEVEDLARDLNESLEDLHRRDKRSPQDNIENLEIDPENENDGEEEKEKILEKKKNKNKTQESTIYMDKIPQILQEPLIILVLYVILSQSFVKNKIGEYIKQINPGPDCNVSFVGIVIYGIILAVLYVIFKKLLLR
ncbi:MAG: hypothetical protein Edafosvirus30_7 [Edafosvirus sp.]|uniref:Uncharacterized protein n=1 Tax=Edafosvirus sp. TaxID=2487765 RepID=A0A3G4ZV28_9VIRU|nr:MAG: hypothetical protein Edafosvirus30_7 [Edafosvirus sp.]